MKTINPPIWGLWNLASYPDEVVVQGRKYRKAIMTQDYTHVVAQYREDVERGSRHLKVYRNGTFTIDHVDDFNPDRGRALEHFFHDHPLGGLAALGLLVGGAIVVGKALS